MASGINNVAADKDNNVIDDVTADTNNNNMDNVPADKDNDDISVATYESKQHVVVSQSDLGKRE